MTWSQKFRLTPELQICEKPDPESLVNFGSSRSLCGHFLNRSKFRLCCDRKARAACAQSFALWQQATIAITPRDHSSHTLLLRYIVYIVSITRDYTPRSLYYCLFAPHIHGCCSSRTSRSWWITHSTQQKRRGCKIDGSRILKFKEYPDPDSKILEQERSRKKWPQPPLRWTH